MSPRSTPLVDVHSIPERPLAFTTPRGEFVDRQRILDDLYDLALLGLKPFSSNMAIIGPRRIGKSAIIERLYNWLWTNQRDVVPLYFSFRTYEGKDAEYVLERMARDLVNQYLAFRDGEWPGSTAEYSIDEICEREAQSMDEGLSRAVRRYIKAAEIGNPIDILEKLADLPRTIADTNGRAIAVFLDEFQVITQMLDRNETVVDLRATFKDAVESPRCNYFITGSAVTIMREQIIGRGPLFGRFTRLYVPSLEQYWGLELVRKLSSILEIEMGEELRAYLVEYTNAQPYYLHCFMKRLHRILRSEGRECADRGLLSTAISAEETEGELSNFFDQLLWDFTQRYKPIAWPVLGFIASHGDDEPIDHGMLYQFLESVKADAPWLERFANLETVEQLLIDLTEADILHTNGLASSLMGPYRFGSDPILKRYVQLMYEHEVYGKSLQTLQDREHKRLAGQLKNLKRMLGYLLESHIKYLMLLWDGREIEALFGSDQGVVLPHFANVYDTMVKTSGDRAYQLDVVAFPRELDEAVWAVECRFRKRRAAAADIEKFAMALEALKEERDLAAVRGWFVSVEGFTTDALDALEEYGIYYSEKDELNALLERFGLHTIAI